MIKGLMTQLRAAWEFFLALVTRFREERVTQTSGSLTYTTLLSLVPFFTVALAITTAFPVFDEWIGSLQLFVLENVLPDTPAVETIIDQIDSFTPAWRLRCSRGWFRRGASNGAMRCSAASSPGSASRSRSAASPFISARCRPTR